MYKKLFIIIILLFTSCVSINEKKLNKDDMYKNIIKEVYDKYGVKASRENISIIRTSKNWESYVYTEFAVYKVELDLKGNIIESK